jgi:anti-sigma factor RsiW
MTDKRVDGLVVQALLYTNGELEGADAAGFEQRLGEDQAAREAVAEAVQLSLALDPHAAPGPDPSYRDQVRRRLGQRRSLWQWLSGRRAYRGHPVLWGSLGAAAAMLITLSFYRTPAASAPARPPEPAAVALDAPAAEPSPRPPSTATVKVWADVTDHTSFKQKHDFLSRPRQQPSLYPPIRQ